MSKKPIYVTKPSLPSMEKLVPMLEEIWANRVLTNGGAFHRSLEEQLCGYLSVPHISLFANGTLALVTALQALRVTGEVITTPYSFVATSNALLWNNIKPVFVDIESESFNIDPKKIESAITPQTTAILAVHVYGQPCNVDRIQDIADRYGLKVIYDAAHSFGVDCHCGKLHTHGDASILSFHATKVFNTFEGGAVVSKDPTLKKRIDYAKNFGFYDEETVVLPGINGKMHEFSSALGLLQLEEIDEVISARKKIAEYYDRALENICHLSTPMKVTWRHHNYAYYPILVEVNSPVSRDEMYSYLKSLGIYTRKYFYPLISEFPMYRNLSSSDPANLPVAASVASRVLCLPIYPGLEDEELQNITSAISEKLGI